LRQALRFFLYLGFAASAAALGSGQTAAQIANAPPEFQAPPPSTAPPPRLAMPGVPTSVSVPAFIDYAGRSGIGEREAIRKLIWSARENSSVANELCGQATIAQRTDHSRALIVLSILGELRNPAGEKCLTEFVHQPLPEQGTMVDGEILEQVSLGTLQGKAVDGLAYAGTHTGDRETLWAAGAHPSRIVRAEAINAYLWNHQDSAAAKEALLNVIRPEEREFLDRPRYEPELPAERFNAMLAAYAAKHPAPKPETRPKHKLTIEAGTADAPPPREEPPRVYTPPQGRE
jgi:hypothetical protein